MGEKKRKLTMLGKCQEKGIAIIDKFDSKLNIDAKEAQQLFGKISKVYSEKLITHNVKLPQINDNKYFQLVFLYKNMGKLIHKDVISEFVNSKNSDSSKDCQVRHLSGSGWNVLVANDEIPGTGLKAPKGYNMLVNMEVKPAYKKNIEKRKVILTSDDFEDIKRKFDYRCATCGVKEGEKHFIEIDKIVVIEQGHMDPRKAMEKGNIIPQCESCNKIYLDNFVFNEKGRIVKVNNPNFILKSDTDIQEEMFKVLDNKLNNNE